MPRNLFPYIKFVKASDQANIDQRRKLESRSAHLSRKAMNRAVDFPKVVDSKYLIRLSLSLLRTPLLPLTSTDLGSNCRTMLQKKYYIRFWFSDKRGYFTSFRINVRKHVDDCKNIGAARAKLRCVISRTIRAHNEKRVMTHVKPKRYFTRKQKATGQILARHYGKAARVLDQAIYECRAVQTYMLFFPELWDDYMCEKLGIASDAHTRKAVGCFLRLNTCAEYVGDLEFASTADRNFFMRSRRRNVTNTDPRLLINRGLYDQLWTGVLRGVRLDPRKDPEVTCLFHHRWPISVTAGEWRLDKEEYDNLLPSRGTGTVQA
jgi:hypothetical protein